MFELWDFIWKNMRVHVDFSIHTKLSITPATIAVLKTLVWYLLTWTLFSHLLLSTSCVEGFSFFAIALVGSGGPNCRPKSLFQCIPGACETSKYFHKKWIISHFSPIKTWENLLFVEVFWCFTYASKECTERLLGLQLGQSLTPRSNYRNCKSHHSFR